MSQATHNALLTATAILSATYAVGLLVAPAPLWTLFDLAPDASGIWVSRLLGVASLSLAAFAFFARSLGTIEARRAIDAGFLVASVGTAAVGMWAMYLRVFNPLGWINVAVFAALGVAYFYFLAGEDRAELGIRARPT